MKISLRKAAALQSALKAAINGSVVSAVSLSAYRDINADAKNATEHFHDEIHHRLGLIAIYEHLRLVVAEANHTVGVSKKLTEVAGIELKIALYRRAFETSYFVQIDDEAALTPIFRAAEAFAKDRDMSGLTTSINVTSFTSSDLEDNTKRMAELKLQKTKLLDEITALNFAHTVDLTDEQEAVLKSIHLI